MNGFGYHLPRKTIKLVKVIFKKSFKDSEKCWKDIQQEIPPAACEKRMCQLSHNLPPPQP